MKNILFTTKLSAFLIGAVLWPGLVPARADNHVERIVLINSHMLGDEDKSAPVVSDDGPTQTQTTAPTPATPDTPATPATPSTPPTPATPATITIQTIEPDGKKKHSKPVTYLGVAVQECSEALSAQLELKPGQGLTVILLAAGSPAEKADFHKNDVLADLDGQMLVHPLQLQKLIQMHAEGDAVKLTFYRSGKKQTATVKLGKTMWDETAETDDQPWPCDLQSLQLKLGSMKNLEGLNNIKDLDAQLKGVGESLERVGLDRTKVNSEVQRTMEQACRALEDAVRHASTDQKSLASVDRELEALVRGGLAVDRDATVTVRSRHNSNRTIVQTDDDGSYIIESGARTRLTVNDKDGKLLFQGHIDTAAEREKVPKQIWEKVKPMLDQIVAPSGSKPKTEGRFRGRIELLKQIAGWRVLSLSLT
jgi:PDZ domain